MHAANAPASSLHSNVAGDSFAVNENDALVLFVSAGGFAVIVVSGAPVSTTHVWVAGVGSTRFAASLARTLNVWEPSARPV